MTYLFRGIVEITFNNQQAWKKVQRQINKVTHYFLRLEKKH